MSQPWWLNYTLAQEFATLVGTQLGFQPNGNTPYFAFGIFPPGAVDQYPFGACGHSGLSSCEYRLLKSAPRVYAVAAPVDEPSILTLLGMGLAGLGLTRYRRRGLRCFCWTEDTLNQRNQDRLIVDGAIRIPSPITI